MSQLSVFKNAGLPAVKSMAAALKVVRVVSTGEVILKMDKTGHWVYGAEQTEIEDDSTWAVNPLSFLHGYICWGKNEVLGEMMVPINQPLPEKTEAPTGSQRGWEPQIGFSMKCLSGEDEGLDVRYAATSVGGRRVTQDLGLSIAEHIDKDESTPVAVVTLSKEHYMHKQYGKIYTPVFSIVKFIPMGLDDANEPKAAGKVSHVEAKTETETEVVEETTTRRRRR